MDQLWAPWRLAYVAAPKKAQPQPRPADPASRADTTGPDPDCFICQAAAGPATEDRANLVVLRTELSVVVLNRYPYNNGHLLVCPRAHEGRLDELTAEEMLDLQWLLRRLVGVLEKRLKPDGFNIGLNLGRAAGAGVPGHLHWHIVPRWVGDTNFMPVVADTKVISQSLEALYDLVSDELASGQLASDELGRAGGEPRAGCPASPDRAATAPCDPN